MIRRSFRIHPGVRAMNTKRTSPKLKAAKTTGADDWREKTLASVRTLIRQVAPNIVEEIKWRKPSNAMRGVPVWSLNGIICTGETYKDKVKLTFAKGAALADPSRLFNSSLEGNTRRAIDVFEGDKIDKTEFKALVREAIAHNSSGRTRKSV